MSAEIPREAVVGVEKVGNIGESDRLGLGKGKGSRMSMGLERMAKGW